MNTVSPNFVFSLLPSLATFFTWLFYFLALQKGDVRKVMAIDKLSIVLIVILGVIFLKEKISLLVILGIILLLTGSILIVLN